MSDHAVKICPVNDAACCEVPLFRKCADCFVGRPAPAARQVRMLTQPEIVSIMVQHWHKDDAQYDIEFPAALIEAFAAKNAGLTIPASGKLEE